MDLRRDYRLPEQVETQNYDEKEVIKENMIRLFNGDISGFLFFDKYFNLPDGKSLSSAKDISQIFSLVINSSHEYLTFLNHFVKAICLNYHTKLLLLFII